MGPRFWVLAHEIPGAGSWSPGSRVPCPGSRVSSSGSQVLGSWVLGPHFRLCPQILDLLTQGDFWERINYFIKMNLNKSTVMGSLRVKLSFRLLCSVNICIRGSRARKVNEMRKQITLMIQPISNMFMASASRKNKSLIVR